MASVKGELTLFFQLWRRKNSTQRQRKKQVKFLFIDFLQNILLDVWKFDFSHNCVKKKK